MAYTFKHGDRPLDDYTIQRAVGRGGFGEVYYAVSDGGREVALKYLRENPQVELRGVSHCMNLKSPHLVTIFDVKKSVEGEYFIVMEYSSGPSLRDLLVAEPDGVGPQKAAFFLREIAKGLGYLHDQGIVHRDLKPGNIFYDEGYVKIGDYGLSKFISVSRHSAQTASVGTVHYMAPEVGSGNYHRGIDIYALGVMLYEMLLGKVPFEGGSMGEVLMKHLTAQPEVADLPEPFGKIIRKALEKDPKDRYQTVYEMVEDLLGVEDVKTSLAGFNPVSLAGIERRAATDEADSPVQSPNPAPPFAHAPSPRPAKGGFELDARQLPPGMEKRIRATSERVEKRVRKLERKFGPRTIPEPVERDARSDDPHFDDSPRSRGEVIQRIIMAAVMAGGLGMLIGLMADSGEEGFAAGILGVMAVSGGIGAGCRLISRLSQRRDQPRWIERLAIALPVALLSVMPMVIFSDRVRDEHALGTWIALVATAMFVDWRPRVRHGNRGEMSLVMAIWPGIFALIVTAMLTDGREQCMAVGGGVAAASALVVQALAWLFPLRRWLEGVGSPNPPSIRKRRFRDGPGERHDARHAHPPVQTPIPEHSTPGGAAGGDAYVDSREEGDEAEPFLVDSRPRRWKFTRIVSALACFVLLIATVVLIAMLIDNSSTTTYSRYDNGVLVAHRQTCTYSAEDKTSIAAVSALCFGMALFAFRKSTRFKTGRFYRDTMRPFLIAIALSGAVAAFAALDTGAVRGDEEAVAVIALIVSLAFLLALLVKRGKKHDSDTKPVTFDDVRAEPTYMGDKVS